MRCLKVILPVFMGTFVYCLLTIIAGPRGLLAMRQLEIEKNRVTANLDGLNTINNDLTARFNNLTADPDTISVFAHELGYVNDGERLIKLAGYNGAIDRTMAAGVAISVSEPEFIPEWVCKLFGLTAFFLSALLPGFLKKYHGHKQMNFNIG